MNRVRIDSIDQLTALLEQGRAGRSTAGTLMNMHSSRSHLVVTVYCTATDLVSNQTRTSKLHLIDLAGSERLSKTGATGDRLTEAQHINKSLSALGDVILALSKVGLDAKAKKVSSKTFEQFRNLLSILLSTRSL